MGSANFIFKKVEFRNTLIYMPPWPLELMIPITSPLCKRVSGGTHGSYFKRSLLLDTVVAKATQRQTTTLLSPSVKIYNLLRGKSPGLILHCRSYSTGILPGTRQLHAYRMALPIQSNAPTWLEDYYPTLQLPHRSFIHPVRFAFYPRRHVKESLGEPTGASLSVPCF